MYRYTSKKRSEMIRKYYDVVDDANEHQHTSKSLADAKKWAQNAVNHGMRHKLFVYEVSLVDEIIASDR